MSKINFMKPDKENLNTFLYLGSALFFIGVLDVFLNAFFSSNITGFLPTSLSFLFPLIIGFIGLFFIRIENSGIRYLDLINKNINTTNFNAILSLLIIFFIFNISFSQEDKVYLKGLTRKEIKDMKRKKKEQDIIARYKAMGLNQWGIDENAQTWYLALKYHLPTSRQSNGLPILRQYQTFTEESSKIYPLWIINGQQFNSPPLDVQALSPLIRKVKILVSAAETNRWGKQARAGVIVLETLR